MSFVSLKYSRNDLMQTKKQFWLHENRENATSLIKTNNLLIHSPVPKE